MNFDDFVDGYAQAIRNDADVFTYNEALKLYSNHHTDRSVGMLAGVKSVEGELPRIGFDINGNSSKTAVDYLGIMPDGRVQYIE